MKKRFGSTAQWGFTDVDGGSLKYVQPSSDGATQTSFKKFQVASFMQDVGDDSTIDLADFPNSLNDRWMSTDPTVWSTWGAPAIIGGFLTGSYYNPETGTTREGSVAGTVFADGWLGNFSMLFPGVGYSDLASFNNPRFWRDGTANPRVYTSNQQLLLDSNNDYHVMSWGNPTNFPESLAMRAGYNKQIGPAIWQLADAFQHEDAGGVIVAQDNLSATVQSLAGTTAGTAAFVDGQINEIDLSQAKTLATQTGGDGYAELSYNNSDVTVKSYASAPVYEVMLQVDVNDSPYNPTPVGSTPETWTDPSGNTTTQQGTAVDCLKLGKSQGCSNFLTWFYSNPQNAWNNGGSVQLAAQIWEGMYSRISRSSFIDGAFHANNPGMSGFAGLRGYTGDIGCAVDPDSTDNNTYLCNLGSVPFSIEGKTVLHPELTTWLDKSLFLFRVVTASAGAGCYTNLDTNEPKYNNGCPALLPYVFWPSSKNQWIIQDWWDNWVKIGVTPAKLKQAAFLSVPVTYYSFVEAKQPLMLLGYWSLAFAAMLLTNPGGPSITSLLGQLYVNGLDIYGKIDDMYRLVYYELDDAAVAFVNDWWKVKVYGYIAVVGCLLTFVLPGFILNHIPTSWQLVANLDVSLFSMACLGLTFVAEFVWAMINGDGEVLLKDGAQALYNDVILPPICKELPALC